MTGTPGAAEDPLLRIDGSLPLSAEAVAALADACDRAEDRGDHGRLIVYVSGAPREPGLDDVSIALVSRWERGLRRLERLPVATVAVAAGDCGGLALDALLATDYRIAARSLRLLVPVASRSIWPGMALYRLSQQAGSAAIRRAVLFGTPIEAVDAMALRLVDELTDDMPAALAVADALTCPFSGTELSIRRQLMLDAASVSFEDAIGVHLAACDRTLRRASAGASS
jgi:isomerase DpgB